MLQMSGIGVADQRPKDLVLQTKDPNLRYGSASDEGLRAERERDLRLLLDATARPIDRAGDVHVRLDSGAMTTQADLTGPALCACAPP